MPKYTPSQPETQVVAAPTLEKRTRRQFTPEYKLRMITEASACKHGEIGELLRREKLYSNQLSGWRREYAANGFAGLEKSLPGLRLLSQPNSGRLRNWRGKLPNSITTYGSPMIV